MEKTTMKNKRRTAICKSGTIAFIIDFKTTCKPETEETQSWVGGTLILI